MRKRKLFSVPVCTFVRINHEQSLKNPKYHVAKSPKPPPPQDQEAYIFKWLIVFI